MASFAFKGFLLIYTRWRSKAGASLRVVRVQERLLAPCAPVRCVIPVHVTPDLTPMEQIPMCFWERCGRAGGLGRHKCGCCIPGARAAGREEEEEEEAEQLCFSIPG